MAENNWIIYAPVQGPVLTAGQQPETVTESRWHQPLSEPTRRRALATALVVASGLFATPYTPPAETVTADKWFAALSEPSRAKPALRPASQVAFAFVEAAPFAEKVSLDRWLLPLSEPVRRRPSLLAGDQQTLAFNPLPVVASADRWWSPLSEPMRRKPALPAGRHQLLAFDPLPFTPSLDWFRALTEPARPHVALAIGTDAQPTGTFLGRGVNLIFANVDGDWPNVVPYARFGGQWLSPIRVSVRFEGVWRTVYSA